MAKIPRWSREVIITEKIDGTNASVLITIDEAEAQHVGLDQCVAVAELGHPLISRFFIFAGSRTRLVTPGKQDNAGFAAWVQKNADDLAKLGPGHHFGEWWGSKIQRAYGFKNGERFFSLFDTRWAERENKPACCDVVPILYRGILETDRIEETLRTLWTNGSFAAPGFMNPKGIIIWHSGSGQYYKKTYEKDQQGKGE